MTTELKITYSSGKHAVLVKMMRGHAIAHEQVIAPGEEGAVLVYAGQTVTIEEIEVDEVAPVADPVPVEDVVVVDTMPDAIPPDPEQPFINTMESMDANTVDATQPDGVPTPVVAPAKPAAKKKPATKK